MSRLLGNPNMGAKVIIGEYRSDIETDREIEKRLPSIFMDINVITTIEGKKLVPIQELLKVEEQVHREQKETYKTAYKKGFDEGKVLLSIDVIDFLKDWLINHIQGSDKKYGPFLNEKGLR